MNDEIGYDALPKYHEYYGTDEPITLGTATVWTDGSAWYGTCRTPGGSRVEVRALTREALLGLLKTEASHVEHLLRARE